MPRRVLRLPVTERSQAAEARRATSDLARSLGFNEAEIGVVAIITTEAATNLVNHAQSGELLVTATDDAAIEILSIDHGPGMNCDRCLEDGYSTAGTAGTGLGAIRRLSEAFDIWSDDAGTVLFARIDRDSSRPSPLKVGATCVPVAGETECGDSYAVRETYYGAAILVVDGLGHGEFAAAAARQATDAFHQMSWYGAAIGVEHLHKALRGTRGAALAIASMDFNRRIIQYSGLGNTSGVILHSGRSQNMVSHNGTAGFSASRIAEFSYEWPEGSAVVMHTDGLTASWSLSRYPGLERVCPAVLSGVLYRDYGRGRDDCTVVTAAEVPR